MLFHKPIGNAAKQGKHDKENTMEKILMMCAVVAAAL